MANWSSMRYATAPEAREAAVAALSEHGAPPDAFAIIEDGGAWFWAPLAPIGMPRASRAAQAEKVALAGEIPEPPPISIGGKAYTYAKEASRLHRAAVAGKVAEIRASRIFGVSTHALLVQRYRRALLVALHLRGMAVS